MQKKNFELRNRGENNSEAELGTRVRGSNSDWHENMALFFPGDEKKKKNPALKF